MQSTFYQTLGVSETASDEEIRKAYKALAKKFHPDLHGGQAFYEEHFKKITEAYQVLSDKQKRTRYDQKLYYARYQYKNTTTTSSTRAPYQTPPRRRPASPPPPSVTPKQARMYMYTGIAFLAFLIACFFFYTFMNGVTSKNQVKEGLEAEKRKNYSDAYSLYSLALEYDNTNAQAYYQRGLLAVNIQENCHEAIRDFSNALEYGKEKFPKAYLYKAMCYLKKREADAAIQNFELAIEKLSGSDSLYLYMGDAYYLRGNYEKAIEQYGKFLLKYPNRVEGYINRGIMHYIQNNYTNAMNDLNKAITIDSGNARAFYHRALIKFLTGDGKSAEEDLEESASMDYPHAKRMLRELMRKDSLEIVTPLD